MVTVNYGNHTYLAAAMVYAVPAAIGAKLARPGAEVVAIVGDGAFLMTCMEIVTAALNGLGIVYYVFHDGELSQIAQAQRITYNRAPCAALGALDLEGVARATGATYVRMEGDGDISQAMDGAHETAKAGRPVIVDVQIDYSRRTAFTQGAVKTNFGRFPLAQKLRMAMRVLVRKAGG